MKFLNFILLMFCCYTSSNISFFHCLVLNSKIKQDAMNSLVIFARSQAEFQREKHQKTMKKHNFTLFDNDELANLLKKRETVNIKTKTTIESLKNSTSRHNSTLYHTHQITNNRSINRNNNHNKVLNKNLRKKDKITSNQIAGNSLNKIPIKNDFNVTKVNQVKNVSLSSNNHTSLKNSTNSTIQNNNGKMNLNTNVTLHQSIHNKKLIML